ncbi:MAG: AgmX/PglI C-terminal domain-containing protein [Polyangiaceae bacterium]
MKSLVCPSSGNPKRHALGTASRALVLLLLVILPACGEKDALVPKGQSFAELREVRTGVSVTLPGDAARKPYPRERLVDGSRVELTETSLAQLRRDSGARVLIAGPAAFTLRSDSIVFESGKVFVDAPPGVTAAIDTPSGRITAGDVRASMEIAETTRVYVLRGEIDLPQARARAGEQLTLSKEAAQVEPVTAWKDWTGGLATADEAAAPSPYGVGTVGARDPGQRGAPRFPLAIQRLDVSVRIDGDFVVTEVDQRFFNPASKTVEGIYRFRAPEGASIQRFGVDRDGKIAWGRVKESAAASAQYQSNVYAGSTEDPALLEWDGPGAYRARLYPIGPGETRRVVVRYTEWLSRTGDRGERRLYVYPMAASGSEASLPRVENFSLSANFGLARAKDVRVGMKAERRGSEIVIVDHDFVPRSDFFLEMFDDGVEHLTAYRAKHEADLVVLPPDDRPRAREAAAKEAPYILVPVRAQDLPKPEGGLDLAIVVDASAANDVGAMALARAATSALLSHLSKDDRVMLWSGADVLRPLLPDVKQATVVDDKLRERASVAMSVLERGGATDLGGMLAEAARGLDPARRGAVVYIGDGRPTVGELDLEALRERLGALPRPVRVFSLGVGADANLALLAGVSRGGFAERVDDAHGAADVALRVFEHAERPAWLGVSLDLGPNVERVLPKDASTLVAGETTWVVARVTGTLPQKVKLTRATGEATEHRLELRNLEDHGDLRRRWAGLRLEDLLAESAGRAALVDLGMRYGIVTPVTSFYVPTTRELREEQSKLEQTEEDLELEEVAAAEADNKEGGSGTRAKGEEGSMGRPTSASNKRYAVRGPSADESPHIARQSALKDAQEFGMIGLLNTGAGGPPPPAATAAPEAAKAMAAPAEPMAPAAEPAPGATDALTEKSEAKAAASAAVDATTAPWGSDRPMDARDAAQGQSDPGQAAGNAWGGEIGDSFGSGGLGLSGIGEGGGGKGDGIGLGNIGTLGHGAGTGTGQGFGSGHGRLGGSHRTSASLIRSGTVAVTGRLPSEVIQRIMRQNFGRYRLCYEQGLKQRPDLAGDVMLNFRIGPNGEVQTVSTPGSSIPDAAVVNCVGAAIRTLSFPQPEGGMVQVRTKLVFAPGDGPAPSAESTPSNDVTTFIAIGVLPRRVRYCSAAADQPLFERMALWRERLGTNTTPGNAIQVYRRALSLCEAPTWRERRMLLTLMLDALGSVDNRVTAWRLLANDERAQDAFYRGLVSRVRTADDRRRLFAALGLRSANPAQVEEIVDKTADATERVKKLRELRKQYPGDFALALALLDALEDTADTSAARELADSLRRRPDADSNVRTSVGEFYLRLAARDAANKESHEAMAKRAFGEIVEFAPDDPVARRLLGDLLRAHGWYSEARRQYETLERLIPDDPSVPLLLAYAARGEGQLEAAVRFTEKGTRAGAPDASQGPAATSRALAQLFLAWGRDEAKAAKRDKEHATLLARAKNLLSAGAQDPTQARVTLSWAHPELHPMLFTGREKASVPAPEGDVTLGVAQAFTRPGGYVVEVRFEPKDARRAARLGAELVLTVVFGETTANERIVRLPFKVEPGGPPVLRFHIEAGEVTRG